MYSLCWLPRTITQKTPLEHCASILDAEFIVLGACKMSFWRFHSTSFQSIQISNQHSAKKGEPHQPKRGGARLKNHFGRSAHDAPAEQPRNNSCAVAWRDTWKTSACRCLILAESSEYKSLKHLVCWQWEFTPAPFPIPGASNSFVIL